MKIEKIDFTKEDLDNIKRIESFGNAHKFMMYILNSGDDNRRNNNPHGITYERMFNAFGEPNFQTEYNESDWWVFEYNGEKYSVDVSSHEEGSMICKFFDDVVYRIYDKKFNQDAIDFYNQLFKQI